MDIEYCECMRLVYSTGVDLSSGVNGSFGHWFDFYSIP